MFNKNNLTEEISKELTLECLSISAEKVREYFKAHVTRGVSYKIRYTTSDTLIVYLGVKDLNIYERYEINNVQDLLHRGVSGEFIARTMLFKFRSTVENTVLQKYFK